jgi:hypothetical protein
MKPITDYLNWPMTEDIDVVLTNLSWEKKIELSMALHQMALEEKKSIEAYYRPRQQNPLTPKQSWQNQK